MKRVAFRKMGAAAVALVVMMGMAGCTGMGGFGAAYEDDECRVTGVSIDRSGVYAEVTATFENKTSSDEQFAAAVVLLDSAGEQIGDALVLSEDAGAGQAVPSSVGVISIDGELADADNAALDRVAELKVESVVSETAMNSYLSSTGERAADPIVGYWACLQTNLAGESHYLGDSGEVYAHFKDDGTWTLTVGDETYDNRWITSDQIDGIPYGISFAGDTWGGVITEEDPVDLLAMASLTDPDNAIVFQRVE